jgi:hypothetical protein
VATFVIESYKQLSPDTGAQAVFLLSQLVEAKNGPSSSLTASPLETFIPPASAIIANVFWFLSLILSLICALGATLVQQWARNYMRQNQRYASMEKRGVLHTILRAEVERFGLEHASNWIVTMLHLAVALFLAGLVIFLFPINIIVAGFSVSLIGLTGLAYAVLSTLPAFATDCSYRTPLTQVVVPIWTGTKRALPVILFCYACR